ncbi:hypothetical protein [Mycolicibacterium vaccae]|uniref:hypothetical protein n=1 Tax=Mycolicibacterium vaccae TaxID=1810 RepID=UPI003D079AB8
MNISLAVTGNKRKLNSSLPLLEISPERITRQRSATAKNGLNLQFRCAFRRLATRGRRQIGTQICPNGLALTWAFKIEYRRPDLDDNGD